MTAVFTLPNVLLILSTFLASSVEMVEALTIVLAVGLTREWRSTLIGVVLALLALAATVAILGPALMLIPIHILQLVIGSLLLIFGLQWLRKAILRASGYKALHDETLIFSKDVREAQEAAAVAPGSMDWYAFTIAFKGVFLEGLEVAFIVLTFGITANAEQLAPGLRHQDSPNGILVAAVGAAAAILLVGIAGVAVRRPLSAVPENTMKFAVGAMLATFGTFWGAEGAGATWPGQDLAIVVILALVLAWSLALVAFLRRAHERRLVVARS
jgi:uncharacterized membrane protein